MKLQDLKSAYDNTTPATRLEETTYNGSVWSVQPGDATYYTVMVNSESIDDGTVAVAFVGQDYDYERSMSRVAIVARAFGRPDGIVMAHPVGGNEYQEQILVYLASVALGLDRPEPEGLAERRKLNNKKED